MSTADEPIYNYIFTVTTGRSGQETLSMLVDRYSIDTYVAFEEPNINPVFNNLIGDIERKLRRLFIETDELLGRGKVLESYKNGDYKYINKIARIRFDTINNLLSTHGLINYMDVSKFFARGLHIGFLNVIPIISVVHLVRDPIENMRSFLNRNKNFNLDNNYPDSLSNELCLESRGMEKGELYLWSWFEMYLRFIDLKKRPNVQSYTEIRTEDLGCNLCVKKSLKMVGINYDNSKENNILMNTNLSKGYRETQVTLTDLKLFEKFVKKIPIDILSRIKYLSTYEPYLNL